MICTCTYMYSCGATYSQSLQLGLQPFSLFSMTGSRSLTNIRMRRGSKNQLVVYMYMYVCSQSVLTTAGIIIVYIRWP